MGFSGQQLGELRDIIRRSFTQDTFSEFLSIRLEKELSDYTKEAGFPTMIYNLLKGSSMEGWELELLEALKNERPKNRTLLMFAYRTGEIREISFAPQPGQAPSLERAVNNEPLLDPESFLDGLYQAKKCICRIELTDQDGRPSFGTGFLIAKDIILTNYHVVEKIIEHPELSSQVRCRFDYRYRPDGSLDSGIDIQLAEQPIVTFRKYSRLDENPPVSILAEWPAGQLDYALVRLDREIGLEPFGLNSDMMPANKENIRGWIKNSNINKSAVENGKHMIILQHPKAQPMKVSIGMSKMMDHDLNYRRVRYNINTEPGSSGSACFDENFKWIALHNMGDPERVPTYNQGVTAISIVDDLKTNGFTDFDICR